MKVKDFNQQATVPKIFEYRNLPEVSLRIQSYSNMMGHLLYLQHAPNIPKTHPENAQMLQSSYIPLSGIAV